MFEILRVPHALIRRNLSFLERVVVSLGVAGLLYGLISSLPAYPLYWDAVLLALVFAIGLWSTPVMYFVAVAVALYPLYSLSIYLTVIFLAIALLGQQLFINNLGATLLVLATPWLAYYKMAWIVPILGALWWGAGGGAWMGGLAALWGKIIFGMSGIDPDWLTLVGQFPSATSMLVRYGPANSLETLTLLIEPISADTTALLYHLLQILAWVFAGALLGLAVERAWMQHRHPWPNVILALIGAIALPLIHLWLGSWLKQLPAPDLEASWGTLAVSSVLSALVVGMLEILRDFFDHPLHLQLPQSRPVERQAPQPYVLSRGAAAKSVSKPDQDDEILPENDNLGDNRDVPTPDSASNAKPGSKSKDSDDLIMLELD